MERNHSQPRDPCPKSSQARSSFKSLDTPCIARYASHALFIWQSKQRGLQHRRGGVFSKLSNINAAPKHLRYILTQEGQQEGSKTLITPVLWMGQSGKRPKMGARNCSNTSGHTSSFGSSQGNKALFKIHPLPHIQLNLRATHTSV